MKKKLSQARLTFDAEGFDFKLPTTIEIKLPPDFTEELVYALRVELMDKMRSEMKDVMLSAIGETLITPGEACRIMGIKKETLLLWDKKGITKPYYFRSPHPEEWRPNFVDKRRRTLKRYKRGELLAMWQAEKAARKQNIKA